MKSFTLLLRSSVLLISMLISKHAVSQTTIWSEDFTYSDGTTTGTASRWTTTTTSGINYFEVRSNEFRAQDTNAEEQILSTEVINIASYTNVSLSADAFKSGGTMEGGDYVNFYYRLNGGAETLFATNGSNLAEFGTVVASQTGLNGTTIQIIVRIQNGLGGLEIYGIDNILVEGTSSVGPGDVSSNLQLWMRADEGIAPGEAINNTEVTDWGDQSSNGFSAVKDGEPGPDYIVNGLNFNPVLRFNRSNQNYLTLGNPSALNIRPGASISGRKNMTIIAAFAANSGNAGSVISKASSSVRDYQLWLGDTDRVVHYTFGRDDSPSYDGRHWGRFNALNEPKISRGIANSSGLTSTINGIQDNFAVSYGIGNGDASGRDVLIGARRNGNNSDDANQLTGDVAEIIIYDSELTSFEAQKVETYLAIKYGITLGYNDSYRDRTPLEGGSGTTTVTNFTYSGTSNDYILSDGTTLAWDGSDNAGYGYNVFGIAKDDDSSLLQTKSISTNVQRLISGTLIDAILTMESESGGLSTDLSFLMVGHQGTDVALQISALPDRALNTIGRQWKVRESTLDAGTVTLEFDLSQYTLTNEGQLNLLIADNSALTNYKNYEGTYNATTDVLTFTGVDFKDADYFTLAHVEELNNSYHMSFNGSSQYIDLDDNNNLTGSFTISAWVKSNTNNRTIVSKGSSSGYEFAINNSGNLIMSWQSSGTRSVTSTNTVPQNIWHHVAVIYNQTTAKLYIDGVENGTENISNSPVTNAFPCFIGASGSSPSNYFSGEIDELRIWNRALTVDQLRFIMNQEIEVAGGNVYGTIIPQSISKHETSSIPWGDLLAYYPFSHIKGNCLFNESNNITQNGRLYYTPNSAIESQTAPLPFVSNNGTDWDTATTWLNSTDLYIPNSNINGTLVDWNIVETSHNIGVNRDVKLLGLISNSNRITVNGDSYALPNPTGYGLTITHYLKLDGEIDLEGESQLVQTDQSDFDVTSTGTLERDQQGYSNTFLYNYWCSPVAPTSNSNYTVPDIIKNVRFLTSGYNGTVSPVANSDYWIWKYSNRPNDNYAEWQHVRSAGLLSVGQGFTMKGPGTATPDQNYVMVGQPNNGDFSLSISPDNDYLVGNPYPSALDANQFILDNISTADNVNATNSKNVINGALYFWDHFAVNSHNLSDYEGGYAIYTLMGGTVTQSTDARINASYVFGTKIPERYIAVGQGFFVSAVDDGGLTDLAQPIIGGDILFKNNQRTFQKEIVTGVANSGSVFFKSGKKSQSTVAKNNIDTRQKIRLMFDSPSGYHRQLLVGVDKNASKGFDLGYEAPLIETVLEDMYWDLDASKLIIQAVNNFDLEQKIPFSLKVAKEGLAIVSIDDLENIDANKNIYVHDIELDTYQNLKESEYSVLLSPGVYTDRFEITFSSNASLSPEDLDELSLQFYFSNEKESIIINNPKLINIKTVEIHNVLSQSVFKVSNDLNEDYLEFKTKQINAGVYIINLTTENSTISKKILIE